MKNKIVKKKFNTGKKQSATSVNKQTIRTRKKNTKFKIRKKSFFIVCILSYFSEPIIITIFTHNINAIDYKYKQFIDMSKLFYCSLCIFI